MQKKVFATSLPYLVCGLAALFYVYDYFIQVAPSVMTHQLMRAFSINAALLGILSASFYYSYTLMQIPAGFLLDRLGARKLLTGAVLISACGATLFGLSPNFVVAGFSRFLIGLGSSFAFISALFLVSRWFSHRYFVFIAGLIQMAGGLGSIFGLAPLALLVNRFGWRETIITAGLATFLLAIIFWFVIRDNPAHAENANRNQNLKTITIKKLIPIFKNNQIWLVALCGMMSWIPVAIIGALWGVPYLMRVYHLSNTAAGQIISFFWIGLALGSPLLGWYTTKIQKRIRPIVICFSVGIIASIIILNANYFQIHMIAVSLFFLGMSSSVQSLSFGLVKDIVPQQSFGTASGFNNMAAIIGGALSQPLVGFLLNFNWQHQVYHGIPIYSAENYRIAFLILPISALFGLLISYFLVRETNCEKISEEKVKINDLTPTPSSRDLTSTPSSRDLTSTPSSRGLTSTPSSRGLTSTPSSRGLTAGPRENQNE